MTYPVTAKFLKKSEELAGIGIDGYDAPDDYSDEERVTEAPSSGVYIAGGILLGAVGMLFGVPAFLF